MTSAQEQTIRRYHELMQVNAVSHVLRAAREVGILDELRSGQRTAEQLCEARSLAPSPAKLLLDALVAVGVIERYGDDYAISQAARLLCQYDQDLGDARWRQLVPELRAKSDAGDDVPRDHFDSIAATQWVHTAAAMQAAEILDVGGEGEPDGLSLLDLGCGSAVWSCAMAHRDPGMRVTAVDSPAALEAARRMAESIEIGDRFATIAGEPLGVELPDAAFDMTLIPQRLHAHGARRGGELLKRAVAATRPGGRVVVIDLFRNPGQPTLTETLAALRIELETPDGQIPTLEETRAQLLEAGLTGVQFTYLAASQAGHGMAVGTRPLTE